MTIASEVLDALLAAGASAEMIVAAVKADAASDEERQKLKRARDTERQRRSRAGRTGKARASHDVTVTPRDTCDAPPNDIYSNPPPSPLVISDEITAPNSISIEPVEAKPAADAPLTPEEVLEAWNDMAGRHSLPKAKLTPKRRKTLASRIRNHSIEDFTEAIRAVPRSPFLLGENQRGWRADFDFFLQPTSFIKLIEGSYDRATH